MEKTLKSPKIPKQKKKEKHWSILFIGNYGKTFVIKRFKTLVILSLFLFISSILLSGLFIFLYKAESNKYNIIKTNIKTSEKNFDLLKEEKEILLTRLVLAEEKNNPKEQNLLPINRFVIVNNLKISTDKTSKNLNIKFKIKNISQNLDLVSGYMFIIMKREKEDNTTWTTIPGCKLVDNKPASYKEGKKFIINCRKEAEFTTNIKEPPKNFKEISIFAYNIEGKLIFAKNFSI
ncbi:MAG: hypothetical protein JRJ44_06790 [Deltaproteobacteria bacterium]|nr:hypothetical protein [Deltaproteobacteria bacterium]